MKAMRPRRATTLSGRACAWRLNGSAGILAGLMPDDAEVLGLLALMEIQASRQRARTRPDGAFIPLTEQDRARWDHLLISRGLDALARAEALAATAPMCMQAALAA